MPSDRQNERNASHPATPESPFSILKNNWLAITKQIKTEIGKNHLSIVAAGATYYILLGIVPILATAISLYGFFANPHDIQKHFNALEEIIPHDAHRLLFEQMDRIANQQSGVRLGAILGILLTLWAGSRAIKALMEALDIIHENEKSRGFISFNATGLALTVAFIALGLLAVILITLLPPIIALLPFPGFVQIIAKIAIWPLLLLIGILAVTLLYRFGPSPPRPDWKWLTPGSVTAVIFWLLSSATLSIYIQNFGNYNKTYGTLGGIVILLLWFWLSTFVFLLGAELDSAIEQQKKGVQK